jgi:AcrR family transcriptional regulator
MKVRELTDRKTQILAAAAALFRQKGYPAANMREIAEAVGMEASSLYAYFDSKEDLLWEIANRSAILFKEEVLPIVSGPLHTQAKLRQMIITHVEVVLKDPDSSAIFVNEWRHLTDRRKEEYLRLRDNYERLFLQVIQQGVRENQFRATGEKFYTLTILSALNWTYQWYRPGGGMSPTEIGEQLAEILLHGLVRNI